LGEDFERIFTITDANADYLSADQSLNLSTALQNLYSSKTKSLKGKRHAGIAPTRFNLGKNRQGAYDFRLFTKREWHSLRAKMYWKKIQRFVFKDFVDNDDDFDSDDINGIRHGMECVQTITRMTEISFVLHHCKIPTHFQDGTLGLDSENANEIIDGEEQNENDYADFSNDRKRDFKQVNSIAIIEANKFFSVWDVSTQDTNHATKLDFVLEAATFLSKYWLYAGLVNQTKIKVSES
jgi:hypothetical protein